MIRAIAAIAGRFEERHPLDMASGSIEADPAAQSEDPPLSRLSRMRLSGDLNVGPQPLVSLCWEVESFGGSHFDLTALAGVGLPP